MPVCPRCKLKTNVTIMSQFNTEMICLPCKNIEQQHPKYQQAVEAELAEIAKGNFNFPGIGKPADL